MKPNCYRCKWRREILGSAHSKCIHPSLGEIKEDPFIQMLQIFASVGRLPSHSVIPKELNIQYNKRGARWFNFPFDFDPVWLENCDGFEEKEENERK